jgi:hypothetical protein
MPCGFRGRSRFGSGAWTRTRITSSKGWRATDCTTPEQPEKCSRRADACAMHPAPCTAPASSPAPILLRSLERTRGEVSERFKEHAWKACVGETQPWVRIPPSPPFSFALQIHFARHSLFEIISTGFRIEYPINYIDMRITIIVSLGMNRDHTFPPLASSPAQRIARHSSLHRVASAAVRNARSSIENALPTILFSNTSTLLQKRAHLTENTGHNHSRNPIAFNQLRTPTSHFSWKSRVMRPLRKVYRGGVPPCAGSGKAAIGKQST